MPDIWMDVDTALAEVPANILPLIDDTDFKSVEDNTVAYNAAGLELIWHFVTTAGAMSSTVVTPTVGGNYDWAHQDGGMYSIEIPASGGSSINNDTEGVGWFTGKATGVLPWRGPTIGFRAAGLNNVLIGSAYSATRGLAGTALPDAAADAAGGLSISDAGGLDLDAQIKTDIDAILVDTGTTLDAALAVVDGIVDAIKAKTDNLPTDPADESLLEAAITAATSPLATAAALAIVAGYLDTEVAAIKAKTDNLPTDPADESLLEAAIAAVTAPTAGQVADAVWDEAISGHLGAGSTGEKLNAAGAADDPWSTVLPGAYGAETAGKIVGNNRGGKLSPVAATVAADATVDETVDIGIIRYADYTKVISGLTIPAAWTKLWLTIKRSKDESDASAILQLIVSNPAAGSTDGILYVNQAAATPTQRTQGSLVVDQPNGTVTFDVDDDITTVLIKPKGNLYYDVKSLTASGTNQLASGLVAMSDAVTKAMS